MIIRNYKISDREKLLEIIKLNIPKYFSEEEEKEFIEYLDHLREDYFVVEINEKIIGSGGINYFMKDKTARISWDMLHPDFQGQGIGKNLVEFRMEKIKNNSAIKNIIVRTSQVVFLFYKKMGFELIKTEKDFWAKGMDLYEMKMEV